MAYAPKSEAYAMFYIVSYFAGVTGDEREIVLSHVCEFP